VVKAVHGAQMSGSLSSKGSMNAPLQL